MKRFTREEMRSFLRAIDKHAPRGSRLVLIGGAAATLSFGVTGGTTDIDTANKIGALDHARDAARKETGWSIPLAQATVVDAPSGYEGRLRRLVLPGVRKLNVFVPEKHDWALMKVGRFEDKDLEHLKAASKSVGFDLKIFEKRFLSEMTRYEPRSRLVIHFLAMIEELYGEDEAERLQRTIKAHPSWR